MTGSVLVAGATGNLGHRIVRALQDRGAAVTALVRPGTSEEKLSALRFLDAQIAVADLTDPTDVARAMQGAGCIVSAVQGLHDVLVGTQSVLLDAAVTAGVPRFIPSDFSTDYTDLPAGENRNFDLRREFQQRLDAAPVAATSVFNGAFAEVLTHNPSLLDRQQHTVGYWEDADLPLDFTTMDDTAAFTAEAALDPQTPRTLRIASFQVTPRELAARASEALHAPYALVRLGALSELQERNHQDRAAHPEGEGEVMPRWQLGQYVQSMFSTHHASLDNTRYPDLSWTSLEQALQP